MSKRLGVVACAVVMALLLHVTDLAHVTSKGAEVLPDEPEKIGFVPAAQLKRINTFVEVAAEADSIDAAIVTLDDYDNDAISTTLSAATQLGAGLDEQAMWNAVLRDRRVSRLYSLLKDLPPALARSRCRAMFDLKLKKLVERWAKFSTVYKNAAQIVVCTDLYWAHHAVRSSVFLCTCFCAASDVEEIIDEWEATLTKAMQESGVDHLKYMRTTGGRIADMVPDELFVLNVLMFVAHRQHCELLDAKGAAILPFPVQKRSLVTWDVPLGTPNDPKKRLESEIPYLSNWGPISVDRRSAIIGEAKASLTRCGAFKGAGRSHGK
jgi:hypothetical protein